jgi:hypothetical protein
VAAHRGLKQEMDPTTAATVDPAPADGDVAEVRSGRGCGCAGVGEYGGLVSTGSGFGESVVDFFVGLIIFGSSNLTLIRDMFAMLEHPYSVVLGLGILEVPDMHVLYEYQLSIM